MNKGLTLRMGQCNTKRYMPHLLEHIRAGRIDAKAMITHRFPFDKYLDAYHAIEASKGEYLKVMIDLP